MMMYFDGHHICTSPFPTEAATFNIKAPSVRDVFHGVFQAIVDPDEQVANDTTVDIEIHRLQPKSMNGVTAGPVSKVRAFDNFYLANFPQYLMAVLTCFGRLPFYLPSDKS